MRGAALFLALAACTTPGPGEGPMILVSSSGLTLGLEETEIHADGTLIHRAAPPGGEVGETRRQVYPEAYARAAAVLSRQGAATRARMARATTPCTDYGTDQITARPPVAGIATLSAQCEDPALRALMAEILAALPKP